MEQSPENTNAEEAVHRELLKIAFLKKTREDEYVYPFSARMQALQALTLGQALSGIGISIDMAASTVLKEIGKTMRERQISAAVEDMTPWRT